jgi:peptide chain release factor subunit 1
MTTGASTAARLLEQTGEHPVVSLFFDLNPDEFATPPARATQARSLIDEAHRAARAQDSLDHEDRKVLEEDVSRLADYLGSDDLPVSGARGLAIFASGQDGLFETVRLARLSSPRVVISSKAYIEPLLAVVEGQRWAAVLVSRRTGQIYAGELPQIAESEQVTDDVRGRSHGGGLSQANYERSTDDEAEHHLRHVGEELFALWKRQPFQQLLLGGSGQDVDRFAEVLHSELRPLVSGSRLPLEPETATVTEVQKAVTVLLAGEESAARRSALAQLEEHIAAGGPAALGIEAVLEALAERRVQTLVLDRNFEARGVRCPSCGLLYAEGTETCPVDGTATEPVDDLREAAVEAAVLQDAAVAVVGEGNDVPAPVLVRGDGIGALLRF